MGVLRVAGFRQHPTPAPAMAFVLKSGFFRPRAAPAGIFPGAK